MLQLRDIVGQDEAVTRLQRTLKNERMPHAFLFAGPDGVGRQTTATALAATILCSQPVTDPTPERLPQLREDLPFLRACGECEDCRMVSAGAHPDFHVVRKELARFHGDAAVRDRVMQELGIEVIRQFLISPAWQAPSRGRAKVFLVLEAELMSNAAQNALLKTLEEPPTGVILILISRRPEQLLPTTRSRCATIRFGPLPKAFVVEKLLSAGVPMAEAEFWSSFTCGSVGRSLNLAAQGMYEVKCDLVRRLGELAAGKDSDLADWLQKTAEKLTTAVVNEAKKQDATAMAVTLARRQATGTLLELMASVYRDAIAVRAARNRPLIHADQPSIIEAVARRFHLTNLAEIVEQLSRYEQLLWRNVNPKVIWDNVVITCLSAAPLNL